MNEGKRVVIYARVATDGLNGSNLSTQVEACRRYADQHGLTVTAEHIITEVYSGIRLTRPGLDRVRALAAGREIDAVILSTIDRLSRDADQLLFLHEEWQRSGVDLQCVSCWHTGLRWVHEVPLLRPLVSDAERWRRTGRARKIRRGEVPWEGMD